MGGSVGEAKELACLVGWLSSRSPPTMLLQAMLVAGCRDSGDPTLTAVRCFTVRGAFGFCWREEGRGSRVKLNLFVDDMVGHRSRASSLPRLQWVGSLVSRQRNEVLD